MPQYYLGGHGAENTVELDSFHPKKSEGMSQDKYVQIYMVDPKKIPLLQTEVLFKDHTI